MLMICETKIDDDFANGQLQKKGFNALLWLDRDKNGGDIMIFIREDIPIKLVLMDKPNENLCIEINLGRANWLIRYFYNPHRKRLLLI